MRLTRIPARCTAVVAGCALWASIACGQDATSDAPRAILVPPAPVPMYSPEPRTEAAQSPAGTEEEWTIQIRPSRAGTPQVNGHSYEEVYRSIPYRKAEYLANPSYRHDSTMEILFGELRPTVIHRSSDPAPGNPPPPLIQPYPLSRGELWNSMPLIRYGSPFRAGLTPFVP